MTRFNKLTNARKPDTHTFEGSPAFVYLDPRTELVSAIATSFLDDKYYESSMDRVVRLKQLIDSILARYESEFLWNLAYIVRQEWKLRSVSHVLVASLIESDLRKDYSIDAKTIADIWVRPDDMAETVAFWVYLNGGLNQKQGGRIGMPYLLRKAIEARFQTMSQFHATKYSGRGTKFSLRNLLRIVRPTPGNTEQSELFAKIIKDELPYTEENWRSMIQKYISEGKSTGEAMKLALDKMGLFAVVNQLNSFTKHEVKEEFVTSRLTNREAIKRSRMLPFRFVTAIQEVENPIYRQALLKALDYSFDNLELPEGNYLIAVDTSGSMQGRPVQQAAMFGAVLAKKAELSLSNQVTVVAFSTTLKEVDTFDKGIFALMESIKITDVGYGTNGYLVYEYAEKAKITYDYAIFLTDMQFHNINAEKNVGKPAKSSQITVVFNLGGYSKTMIPFDPRTNLVEVPGFSEKIFDYLEVVNNRSGLVDFINQYKIKN